MTDTPQDASPQDATPEEWAERSAPSSYLLMPSPMSNFQLEHLRRNIQEQLAAGWARPIVLPSSAEWHPFPPERAREEPDYSWLQGESWWARLKRRWNE